MEFREQVGLAPYTTFQIGGPARWFAEVRSEEDVVAGATFARERNLPLFVLGGGSNVLVADRGFDGLVLHIVLSGIKKLPGKAGVRSFQVAAGENWDGFVTHAVAKNCGGVECLAGIPGTGGGTPIQNVGAYGQEVSTTITAVRAFDLERGDFVDLSAAQCGFAYRQSIFNSTARGRYLITSVVFGLQVDIQPLVNYSDLKLYFNNYERGPNMLQVTEAVREIRRQKGMLLVPGDDDCRSAGSFFKNPVVDFTHLEALAEASGLKPSEVPRYAAGEGKVKLPAAWLLEQAGFHKGFILGRAAISTRHTLALTNRGGATKLHLP